MIPDGKGIPAVIHLPTLYLPTYPYTVLCEIAIRGPK